MTITEKVVSFNEAMKLWKEGKAVCCKIGNIEYALNTQYSEERETHISSEKIEKGIWTVLIMV